MHTDLSPHLHSEGCNDLILALANCYSERPYAKYLGSCDNFYTPMIRCLKQERLKKRNANYTASVKHHTAIKERLAQAEKDGTLEN